MALKLGCLKRQMKLLDWVIMSANSEKVYYAVARGRRTGIYESWNECKAQTVGFQNAKFRKFNSAEQAQEFVDFWKNYSIPVQNSFECKQSEESDTEEKMADDYVKASENDESEPTFVVIKQEQERMHHQETSARVAPPECGRSPNSSSLDNRYLNQYNPEILALHHRFDSFERRFDSVLKDVGAILSELSHLRRDVKELSDSLRSVRNFPGREKGDLVQSTLNFGSLSARTRKSDFDSEEPKRKKKFMRSVLSKSGSFESLKVSEKDRLDELVDNMEKMDEVYFTTDKDGFVEVYTDGCSLKNGALEAKAGIGVWFGDDHPLNVGEPVAGSPTSTNAEIQAARTAMRLAIKYGVSKLKIFTDSEFLFKSATSWIRNWKKNGWILKSGGPVKNRNELEKLDKYMSEISVLWVKVQGHMNILGNERADRLANIGAAKFGS